MNDIDIASERNKAEDLKQQRLEWEHYGDAHFISGYIEALNFVLGDNKSIEDYEDYR